MSQTRTYLDWNASAPLRPEARAAMIAAMDEVGNPSSVHAEGRRAKAIVERARAQVAELVGCDRSEVVFTSGATEAAVRVIQAHRNHMFSDSSHDCVLASVRDDGPSFNMGLDQNGLIATEPGYAVTFDSGADRLFVLPLASGETGVIECDNTLPLEMEYARVFEDATQLVGKRTYVFANRKAQFSALSAHKLGGSKGVGASLFRSGVDAQSLLKGGGQEHNRRAGTENVIGIAGFGAAAEAAQRDLANGEWDRVEEMRNLLEETLTDAAPDLIVFGKDAPRLPNTSCFAIPGWRGETQVMQMDLAGFAISAGSACSSGKVNKASRVLLAMGFDEITASSAVRVSMGPTTTMAEITAFADAWIGAYRRWKAKAA